MILEAYEAVEQQHIADSIKKRSKDARVRWARLVKRLQTRARLAERYLASPSAGRSGGDSPSGLSDSEPEVDHEPRRHIHTFDKEGGELEGGAPVRKCACGAWEASEVAEV